MHFKQDRCKNYKVGRRYVYAGERHADLVSRVRYRKASGPEEEAPARGAPVIRHGSMHAYDSATPKASGSHDAGAQSANAAKNRRRADR